MHRRTNVEFPLYRGRSCPYFGGSFIGGSTVFYLVRLRYSLICAGECIWFTLDFIKEVMEDCRKLFPVCSYSFVTIPTYPCGQIGFVLASKNKVQFCSSLSLSDRLFACLYTFQVFVAQWTLTSPNSLGSVPVQISDY